MRRYDWYDLALPDGTPLLAYSPRAEVDETGALRLCLTLEAASAELVADSGLYGPIQVPADPALELHLTLRMEAPPRALAAALAQADSVVEALCSPAGRAAHDLGAFTLEGVLATTPLGH